MHVVSCVWMCGLVGWMSMVVGGGRRVGIFARIFADFADAEVASRGYLQIEYRTTYLKKVNNVEHNP